MARLFYLNQGNGFPDGLDQTWFFRRLRYRRNSYKRHIDWWATYADTCPHIVYVDREHIDPPHGSPNRPNKIAIREFIDEHCVGLVILAYKDLSFSYKRKGSVGYISDWHNCNRGYYVFHFQDAASAVAFKLRFADITEDFAQIERGLEEYYEGMEIRWNVQEGGELIPVDDEDASYED